MTRSEAKIKAAALTAKLTVEECCFELRYDARAIPDKGIPEYNYWNEALHGVARAGTATVFPQAIALGAGFDAELVREIADAISTEGRAKYNYSQAHGDRGIYKGLTFWSPNINIFRDPRWGRGHETYGEDPYLTSRLGVAFVKGLQGEGDTLKAAACAKHYAVHSGPEAIRHEFDAVVSKKDLWETYLPAFEALVREAGVEAVMGAYNAVYGEPACGSKFLLTEILREKWGFDGHVVSDCWAISDFHLNHKVTATPRESAAKALNAGCDLNCGNTFLHLLGAYEDGLVTEDAIRQATTRVLTTRFRLGILGGEGSEFDAIPFEANDSAKHRELADRAALETCVLLKNDGILPLKTSALKSIAVIGPNADSRTPLVGNYHGTPGEYVTVLDGIRRVAEESIRVNYAEGCHLYRGATDFLVENDNLLAEALATAENSDLTVLVLGLDETIEGEEGGHDSTGGFTEGENPAAFGGYFDTDGISQGGDKKDLRLPKSQRRLLEALSATGKPIVLVLMAGSAMDLRCADENCAAILNAWYPGGRGGLAVAKLLFGEASPCGKLPITFYKSTDDLPEFTDYAMANRTYRYYKGEVLYPFGFGLTYGNCAVTGWTRSGNTLTVDAVNAGSAATKDVLQVYVKCNSPYAPPNPVLCAFAKPYLKAGETKTLTLELPENFNTVVDDDGNRILSGSYELFVKF
ncbi:MAG: glycoside hydrolase family 3 C-terminal domain-containing protein [Oscillospiraceae bacterium]|jgi:beta-glucosidase|nr:glycoside hydrolase family 3 C-terminal domain-containing protein [Oscillospiraceae bacterium]